MSNTIDEMIHVEYTRQVTNSSSDGYVEIVRYVRELDDKSLVDHATRRFLRALSPDDAPPTLEELLNALAETINGLYKTEVIRRKGPWRNVDDVEYATLVWVDWFNSRRLLEPLGYMPPKEFEAMYYQ